MDVLFVQNSLGESRADERRQLIERDPVAVVLGLAGWRARTFIGAESHRAIEPPSITAGRANKA
jgi:hypothetical protein